MHDNGQIKGLAQFKDGKPDGLETLWDENGQKEGERNYKDGKLDGLETIGWYENGQKKNETTYKDGKEVEDQSSPKASRYFSKPPLDCKKCRWFGGYITNSPIRILRQ